MASMLQCEIQKSHFANDIKMLWFVNFNGEECHRAEQESHIDTPQNDK